MDERLTQQQRLQRRAQAMREAKRQQRMRMALLAVTSVLVIAVAAVVAAFGMRVQSDSAAPAAAAGQVQATPVVSDKAEPEEAASAEPSAQDAPEQQEASAEQTEGQAPEQAEASAEASAAAETAEAAPAEDAYKGVEDPWVEGGWFTSGNPELDRRLKDFCDSFTEEGATREEAAYLSYLHVSWYEYTEREDNQDPRGPDWSVQYALDQLVNDEGNCYNFSALVEWVLHYFGYEDAIAEPCIIELQGGSWGDHGLTFVTMDGEEYLIDAARSSLGWKIPRSAYNFEIVDIGQHPEQGAGE